MKQGYGPIRGDFAQKILIENLTDISCAESGYPRPHQVRSCEIEAIPDPDAMITLLLPEELVAALGLEIFDEQSYRAPDGQAISSFCASAIRLTVFGREMMTDCLVGPAGCRPVLGHLVMSRLDLICDAESGVLRPRADVLIIKMRTLSGARSYQAAGRG